MALADLESVERAINRLSRAAKSGDKQQQARLRLAEKVASVLADGKPARVCELTEAERPWLKELQLITAKPLMYVANVDEGGFQDNPLLDAVCAYAQAEQALVVPVCASLEGEIARLPEAERAEFLADLGLSEPGLDRVIHTAYTLLGLQTFFTAGVKEVRAWTVQHGATAPKAAGVIHTDFERGFIRAEVIGYDDYIRYGGEQGAKDAGRWRLEGKEYLMQEADVVHFRFNV